MIVIVDYGMGNVGSIVNMLKVVGAESIVSSRIGDIEQADKLILPGVGSFDRAMENLEGLKIIPLLNQRVMQAKVPILGICLGMQLFANSSEEGQKAGLNWIDGKVKRFKFERDQFHFKVPHMGWNFIKLVKFNPILKGLENGCRFYFVHSYHFICEKTEDELTNTTYGYEFTSAVKRGNIIGVQFHPEKSHRFGMRLLENFVRCDKNV